jgi:mRNA-degrading endonuclease toxin of MazEF toxin-antitoxin module
MIMKPGAIHEIESLVPFGGSDDARDLVLVLHDDDAFLHESATVLVIPLAPVPQEVHGHPLVRIAPTLQNGLKKPSVAAVNRLHDVDRNRIGDRVGEIDRSVLIDVYRILDRLIGRHPTPPRPTSSGDTRHEQL